MWLAILAGAVLRAAFVLHHPRVAGDALVYGDLAQNLLHHQIFGLTEGRIRPTLIRLPGYPIFLAACFRVFGDARYVAVLWVQVAVDLLGCGLLAVLAARLWTRRAGIAVLWMAALCPFMASYTAVAITETLSIFCVIAAFFSLERWLHALRAPTDAIFGLRTWAVTTGMALAAAVLLRPDQGLLAAAVLPCMAWFVFWRRSQTPIVRRSVGSFGITTGIFLLPLLLWSVRNWEVFHVVQPLAPRYATDPDEMIPYGFQRWYRTWAIDFQSSLNVYWSYDGESLHLSDLPQRAFDSPAQRAETAALFSRYNEEQAASPKLDAGFARLARERVATHPIRYYVVLPVARELNMWLRPRTEGTKLPIAWWRFAPNRSGSAAALAYATLNAMYLALGGFGLWCWQRRGLGSEAPLPVAALGFVVLRCALLLTIDNSEPRYTLECFPVVILLAGLALSGREEATFTE